MIPDIAARLERRVSSFRRVDSLSFQGELIRFLAFLSETPLLYAICLELDAENVSINREVENWLGPRVSRIEVDTHSAEAALGLNILKRVKQEPGTQGMSYHNFVLSSNLASSLKTFLETYLQPLVEEFRERLSERNAVLGCLVRYKHWVEWFHRQEFYALFTASTQSGEKVLAKRLYEFLYNNGVEFSVEPSSASGEPDISGVLSVADKPLIADVKVFDPSRSKGKNYLWKGVRQVYAYLQDYNRAVGYLLYYKTSQTLLNCSGGEAMDGCVSFEIGGKTIFLVEVDLFVQDSASVRPIAYSVTLTQAEVVREVEPEST